MGWALRLAGTVLLAASCGSCGRDDGAPATVGAGPADPRPDLVLVLIDTLRPDHLESHGYAKETAPFLARLAARSWVWPRAYSTSSWTPPATASVFSGLYPTEHGVTSGLHVKNRSENIRVRALPRSIETLPERLSRAGYTTFGVAANVNIGSALGFDRGFDHFRLSRQADAAELVDTALSWRPDIHASEPFFLYLHFNDAHRPYHGREPWYRKKKNSRRDTIARYDSEISFLDRELERLFDALELDEDAVVMLVSDHGEGFGDGEVRGHGYSLAPEVHRVLLMLQSSILSPASGTSGETVSLVDVFATLLDLAGEHEGHGRGRSLLDLARAAGDTPFPGRPIFAHRVAGEGRGEEGAALWGVIRGNWKLVQDDVTGSRQLFEIGADGTERPESAAPPAVLEDLASELEAFRRDSVPLASDLVEIPLDDELFEHLEALGYAGEEER